MIVRIHHITQTVVDLHESIGELEQMGYVPFRQFRSRSTDAEVVLMTHPNGVGVELFKFADPDMPAAVDMRHHIALESTDLERDLGVRLEGGAKLVRDVSEGAPVRRFCFIRDTAGNLIELVEPWAEELVARSSR
jgi:catechol 2,3-dioxygenase-like lactoylglutathione lyase family enzyme